MSLNLKLYNVDGLTFFLFFGMKTEKRGEDRISELADGVLISVLSFMTMKEAIKTSVLSCRWEKLRPSQPYLNLDAWTFS
jgi:hypothetical protein